MGKVSLHVPDTCLLQVVRVIQFGIQNYDDGEKNTPGLSEEVKEKLQEWCFTAEKRLDDSAGEIEIVVYP